MGTLAVCEYSNSDPRYARLQVRHFIKEIPTVVQETYGNIDAEAIGLKGSGWYTEDPMELSEQFGGVWKTTDFAAGDVLIFGMQ